MLKKICAVLAVLMCLSCFTYVTAQVSMLEESDAHILATVKTVVWKVTGEYELVKNDEIKKYANDGWFIDGEEQVVTIYKPTGERETVAVLTYKEFKKYLDDGWYGYSVCYVYSMDGEQKLIPSNEYAKYIRNGWYDAPSIKVYSPDGKEKIIEKDDLEVELSLGWYEEPVCYLYNPEGKKSVVPVAQVDKYLAQGWSEDMLVVIYSTDGREAAVEEKYVDFYKQVGWHLTKEEAESASTATVGADIKQPAVNSNNLIDVFVDSKQIVFDVRPVIINGSTMVPLRAIFEALGAEVEWHNATKTIVSTRGNVSIFLPVFSTHMFVNGNKTTLNEAATIIDGRTLVPVRAISEAFGCAVGWDSKDKIVSIIDDKANYIFLYAEGGKCRIFECAKSCAQIEAGWYRNKELTDKTPHVSVVSSNVCDYCGINMIVTVYNAQGESRQINRNDLDDYVKNGWQTEKFKIYPTKVFTTASLQMTVGETKSLIATFEPATATETYVTWSSSNPNVVAVSRVGEITAISTGTATVSVETANGLRTSCSITVKEKPVSYFSFVEAVKKYGEYEDGEYTLRTLIPVYKGSSGMESSGLISLIYDTTKSQLRYQVFSMNEHAASSSADATDILISIVLEEGTSVYDFEYTYFIDYPSYSKYSDYMLIAEGRIRISGGEYDLVSGKVTYGSEISDGMVASNLSSTLTLASFYADNMFDKIGLMNLSLSYFGI